MKLTNVAAPIFVFLLLVQHYHVSQLDCCLCLVFQIGNGDQSLVFLVCVATINFSEGCQLIWKWENEMLLLLFLCLSFSAAASVFSVRCFQSVLFLHVGLRATCLTFIYSLPVTTDNLWLRAGPIIGTGDTLSSS